MRKSCARPLRTGVQRIHPDAVAGDRRPSQVTTSAYEPSSIRPPGNKQSRKSALEDKNSNRRNVDKIVEGRVREAGRGFWDDIETRPRKVLPLPHPRRDAALQESARSRRRPSIFPSFPVTHGWHDTFIVNTQISFTTEPSDALSLNPLLCTDVAKMIEARCSK